MIERTPQQRPMKLRWQSNRHEVRHSTDVLTMSLTKSKRARYPIAQPDHTGARVLNATFKFKCRVT